MRRLFLTHRCETEVMFPLPGKSISRPQTTCSSSKQVPSQNPSKLFLLLDHRNRRNLDPCKMFSVLYEYGDPCAGVLQGAAGKARLKGHRRRAKPETSCTDPGSPVIGCQAVKEALWASDQILRSKGSPSKFLRNLKVGPRCAPL